MTMNNKSMRSHTEAERFLCPLLNDMCIECRGPLQSVRIHEALHSSSKCQPNASEEKRNEQYCNSAAAQH